MKRVLCLLLILALLFSACACSDSASKKGNESVKSDSTTTVIDIPGCGVRLPTPYEKQKLATHFVIASCTGVEIKDKTITFAFYPIVVYMGDFGEKMFTEITEHYYAEGFYVQGNVKEYSLNDVYAQGNSYLLWLNERKIINGTAYYNDLKPYGTEAVRVLEEHEYPSFEGIEQVWEDLYSPSQANTGLLRFVEDFMAEKQKETNSQTTSTEE